MADGNVSVSRETRALASSSEDAPADWEKSNLRLVTMERVFGSLGQVLIDFFASSEIQKFIGIARPTLRGSLAEI